MRSLKTLLSMIVVMLLSANIASCTQENIPGKTPEITPEEEVDLIKKIYEEYMGSATIQTDTDR